jgi:hypothetical protein
VIDHRAFVRGLRHRKRRDEGRAGVTAPSFFVRESLVSANERPTMPSHVTVELSCPHCGRSNEFMPGILAIEPVAMSDARRQLVVLTKRLGWAGREIAGRARRSRRQFLRLRSRLRRTGRSAPARDDR